jgi:murein DD-endopeptidase MepM/ murein hydrolase activator NlpD
VTHLTGSTGRLRRFLFTIGVIAGMSIAGSPSGAAARLPHDPSVHRTRHTAAAPSLEARVLLTVARRAEELRVAKARARRAEAALDRSYREYLLTLKYALATRPRTCPVEGPVRVTNSFGDPRDGGTRRHEGNDIFAARGTLNVAITSGVLTQSTSPKGGRGAWITAANGDTYYYAHFDAWVGAYPRRVTTGDVIGYTGSTGNADGGPTHTHFEYHPRGGPAVDPYPLLSSLCP